MDTSKEFFANTCVRACMSVSVRVRVRVRAVAVVVAEVSTWGLHVGLMFQLQFTLSEYWHQVKVTHTLVSKGGSSQ